MHRAEEEGSQSVKDGRLIKADKACEDGRALDGARSFFSRALMPNPRINPVLLVSPVENGYVAYDPLLDRLHQLNPVAALITELSDGSRGVEEISELASPFVPERNGDEISRWIAESVNAGLLVWDGTPSSQAGELSAAELLKLTK